MNESLKTYLFVVACGLLLGALSLQFASMAATGDAKVLRARLAQDPTRGRFETERNTDALLHRSNIEWSLGAVLALAGLVTWLASPRQGNWVWRDTPALLLGLYIFLQFMFV